MAAELFTDAWAAGWAKEINASDAYRVAGLRWESGFVLVMDSDPAIGLAEQRAVFVQLSGGECKAGRAATTDDLETAPYVLRASPAVWRQVIGGDLEPVGAVMTGLMDLARGNLIGLAPWVGAAKELLSAACRVECDFPEDEGSDRAVGHQTSRHQRAHTPRRLGVLAPGRCPLASWRAGNWRLTFPPLPPPRVPRMSRPPDPGDQRARAERETLHLPARGPARGRAQWMPMKTCTYGRLGLLRPRRRTAPSRYCDTHADARGRSGRLVGRVMGIINHRHNEAVKEKTARFALLEARRTRRCSTPSSRTSRGGRKRRG